MLQSISVQAFVQPTQHKHQEMQADNKSKARKIPIMQQNHVGSMPFSSPNALVFSVQERWGETETQENSTTKHGWVNSESGGQKD